uniref:Uncharacterized protein n=1 Tax=Arundo donax TaxID=35708 RepID=A0A0A9BBJ4_ARUDO
MLGKFLHNDISRHPITKYDTGDICNMFMSFSGAIAHR